MSKNRWQVPPDPNLPPQKFNVDWVATALAANKLNTVLFSEAVRKLMPDLTTLGSSLSLNLQSNFASALESPAVNSLQKQISEHKTRLTQIRKELADEKSKSEDIEKQLEAYSIENRELKSAQDLWILLSRVGLDAIERILASEELKQKFIGSAEHEMYVMSVDIRRSTELMLKALHPSMFAKFITSLCEALEEIVKRNHGVVDKFTGDGILCYFPTFFTGEDAGLYALRAADQCHTAFRELYNDSRAYFVAVLLDTGLGIGMDYGVCPIVSVAGGLTVVGSPVVYACRFAGAPAGKTLLNFHAYDNIRKRHAEHVVFSTTSMDVKHEGNVLAYEATLSNQYFTPGAPAWMSFADSVSESATPPEESNPKTAVIR